MMRFQEGAQGSEAKVRVGEEFEILLGETRTAGYKWAIEKGGEPVCTLVSESAEAAGGPPGKAGSHLLRFRAVQEGTTTILLQHKRSWESGSEPGRVFHDKSRQQFGGRRL